MLSEMNCGAGKLSCAEIEIEDHATSIRACRQDQVRVHHSLIGVDHEIREDPPVVRHAGPHLAHGRIPAASLSGSQGADLNTRVAGDFRSVFGIIEHAGEAGMD